VEVFVANEQDLRVDEQHLSLLARHALVAEGVEEEAELSVLLVTRDHIRQLNARFAGEDQATDVLAFPMMEDEEEGSLLLGDVVICPSIASRNAERVGHGLDRELDMLLVHGTLHLLGYDHDSPEERAAMNRRTRELLESFRSVRR
jgi:probable rRNA maturation factor